MKIFPAHKTFFEKLKPHRGDFLPITFTRPYYELNNALINNLGNNSEFRDAPSG